MMSHKQLLFEAVVYRSRSSGHAYQQSHRTVGTGCATSVVLLDRINSSCDDLYVQCTTLMDCSDKLCDRS
jgi:hypothetical protein